MIAPKKFFWLLVFSALVLAACSPAAPTQTAAATPVPASAVISEGHIFPEKYTALSFLAAGVVKDVNIAQGDQVKQGDVLLRLDNADQAEAQVVAAQQAYDTFLRTAGSDHAGAAESIADARGYASLACRVRAAAFASSATSAAETLNRRRTPSQKLQNLKMREPVADHHCGVSQSLRIASRRWK